MGIFRPSGSKPAANQIQPEHATSGTSCVACSRARGTEIYDGDRLCSGCAGHARAQDAAN